MKLVDDRDELKVHWDKEEDYYTFLILLLSFTRI